MVTDSSGSSCGFSGSRFCDQSMRVLVFHCRFLPFSYSVASAGRPSVYSHLKTVSNFPPTFHCG